jgi:hypothetical protein
MSFKKSKLTSVAIQGFIYIFYDEHLLWLLSKDLHARSYGHKSEQEELHHTDSVSTDFGVMSLVCLLGENENIGYHTGLLVFKLNL